MSEERLDDSICLDAVLPVNWRQEDGELGESALHTINQSNLGLFHALGVLEDSTIPDLQEHGPLGQEVLRLDAKLDLVIAMLAQLLREQMNLPGEARIILTSRAVRPESGRAPVGNGFALCELYLYPGIGVPLSLPVTFSGNEGEIYGLSKDVQNALDKYLFRQHRRAIATAKKPRDD